MVFQNNSRGTTCLFLSWWSGKVSTDRNMCTVELRNKRTGRYFYGCALPLSSPNFNTSERNVLQSYAERSGRKSVCLKYKRTLRMRCSLLLLWVYLKGMWSIYMIVAMHSPPNYKGSFFPVGSCCTHSFCLCLKTVPTQHGLVFLA
jgi:hypothetical protein